MIIAEKIPTQHPRILATIMFLASEWGDRDALAGMYLTKLISKSPKTIATFIEDVTGVKQPLNISALKTGLLLALEVLSRRYKTFKALYEYSKRGGKYNLYKVAKELGVEVNKE